MCTEMQSGAFWDTILRNVRVCALTSSRLDDFFWYSYLYTVMITIFFLGGGGSFCSSNTLPNKIWTSEHLFGVAGCPLVFTLKKQSKTNKQTKLNKQNTRSETEKPALCCAFPSGATLFLRKKRQITRLLVIDRLYNVWKRNSNANNCH